MDEPVEELYFNWLYHKVASVDVPTPSLTFYTLLRDLHSIEFLWYIQGDDNRAQDGLDIRKEFLRNLLVDTDDSWIHFDCSILEFLIGLSRRAEFNTSMTAREWFWIFLENLGLSSLNDARLEISKKVYKTIDIFLTRTYQENGQGGLFPLKNPIQNQQEVEIWYQFHAYIYENDIY